MARRLPEGLSKGVHSVLRALKQARNLYLKAVLILYYYVNYSVLLLTSICIVLVSHIIQSAHAGIIHRLVFVSPVLHAEIQKT